MYVPPVLHGLENLHRLSAKVVVAQAMGREQQPYLGAFLLVDIQHIFDNDHCLPIECVPTRNGRAL
jgi:hypothetical protein